MTSARTFPVEDDFEMDESENVLSVLEIIAGLRAMEASFCGDPCLEDLRPQLSAIRAELEERRRLAAQVADEEMAESLRFLN